MISIFLLKLISFFKFTGISIISYLNYYILFNLGDWFFKFFYLYSISYIKSKFSFLKAWLFVDFGEFISDYLLGDYGTLKFFKISEDLLFSKYYGL